MEGGFNLNSNYLKSKVKSSQEHLVSFRCCGAQHFDRSLVSQHIFQPIIV